MCGSARSVGCAVIRSALLVSWIAILTGVASAGERSDTPDRSFAERSAWSVVGVAPPDAEMVVVLDDLDAERHRREAVALVRALESSGLFGATLGAWDRLSERVGLEPGDAVGALLGTRVLLAVDTGRADEPGGFGWVLASVIDRDAMDRLRRAFDPAPRGAVAGVTSLWIEDGTYRAAVVPEANRGGRGESWVLVLAPETSAAMQGEVVRALRGHGGVSDPGFDELAVARSVLEGDGVVVLRRDEAGATGVTGLSAAIRRVPGGWRASASLDAVGTGTGLDATTAEAVLSGAALAFVGRIDDAAIGGGVFDPEQWAGVLVEGALRSVFQPTTPECAPADGVFAVRHTRGVGEMIAGARVRAGCTGAETTGLGSRSGEGVVTLPAASVGSTVFGPMARVELAGEGGSWTAVRVLGVRDGGGDGSVDADRGSAWPAIGRLFDPSEDGERMVLAGVIHPGELASGFGEAGGVLAGLERWVERLSWWAWSRGVEVEPGRTDRLIGRGELLMRLE
jgi:hypothetical protein